MCYDPNFGGDPAPAPAPSPPTNPAPSSCADNWFVGSKAKYANAKTITLTSPSTNSNDMLFLWVMRSDGRTPLKQDGWTRAAECLKQTNTQSSCYNAANCKKWSSWKPEYCSEWAGGDNGSDLSNVLFYRRADPNKSSWTIKADWHAKPTWVIMVAVKGSCIDMNNPIRGWKGRSSDGNKRSKFPSVEAKKNDILLLSMSHDSSVPKSAYTAPDGMQTLAYTYGPDETGFAYGGRRQADGWTGELITNGDGGYGTNSDDLVAVVVRGA